MAAQRALVAPLDGWLEKLWGAGGTDLLLTVGSAPLARVDGELMPLGGEAVLTSAVVRKVTTALLGTERTADLDNADECDFSFGWREQARIRGNAFRQRGEVALSLRMIPFEIPSFEDLQVPRAVRRFADLRMGLVLVTGPTGSGKSTTLASMIDAINTERAVHIVTIEDPVEYVHNHKRAAVSQREVGIDTASFAAALRSALREDPDVILVGEMRDLESIQFALTLAETGHLVLATLHTNDSAQAIDRLVDVFPGERQAQIRVQLANCLSGVVYQRLVRAQEGGMVAAYEVLVATPAVRNLVREGKSNQLRNVVATHQSEGMQTLESSLGALVDSETISLDDAMAVSAYPKEIGRSSAAAVSLPPAVAPVPQVVVTDEPILVGVASQATPRRRLARR